MACSNTLLFVASLLKFTRSSLQWYNLWLAWFVDLDVPELIASNNEGNTDRAIDQRRRETTFCFWSFLVVWKATVRLHRYSLVTHTVCQSPEGGPAAIDGKASLDSKIFAQIWNNKEFMQNAHFVIFVDRLLNYCVLELTSTFFIRAALQPYTRREVYKNNSAAQWTCHLCYFRIFSLFDDERNCYPIGAGALYSGVYFECPLHKLWNYIRKAILRAKS